MKQRILIIGACGQIGTELTLKLRREYGKENVIASDLKEGSIELMASGLFLMLDATDKESIAKVLTTHQITQVYMMAAMLSATAEKIPLKAWHLNMTTLLIILELGKEGLYKQLFWPSSIGAFGPTSPKENTPQTTVMLPTTVYGISKYAGEMWCLYYATHYGVDVRTVRYPGIISYKTKPGGGTTACTGHAGCRGAAARPVSRRGGGRIERLRIARNGFVSRAAETRREAAGEVPDREVRFFRRDSTCAGNAAQGDRLSRGFCDHRNQADRGDREPHRQGTGQTEDDAVVMVERHRLLPHVDGLRRQGTVSHSVSRQAQSVDCR